MEPIDYTKLEISELSELWEPEPEECLCLLTIQNFIDSCKLGHFTDLDGFGELATIDHISRHHVVPSRILDIPNQVAQLKQQTGVEFTHVMWFNK